MSNRSFFKARLEIVECALQLSLDHAGGYSEFRRDFAMRSFFHARRYENRSATRRQFVERLFERSDFGTRLGNAQRIKFFLVETA